MDYNQQYQNNNNYYQQPAPTQKRNNMAIASMVCGIVALVMCCMGLSLPLGALAILFAILSRRKGQTMNSMSIAGIVTGIIGLLLGIVIMLYSLFLMQDPYFQRGMYDSFEEVYGEDFADMMGEMYGFDLDEIKDLEY